MLNIPYVQHKVTNFAENELSNFFGTSVEIGTAEINWFNRIVLKDLQILDLKGEIVLKASNITAGFKPLSFLKNKWILTTIRLFGISCHINKETSDSEMNIQFILDALSGNTQGNSSLQIQMQSILIRRGMITFDILDSEITNQQFNINHLNIDNLSCKLSVNHFSKDSLNVQIGKMSFKEKSGLQMNKLSAQITRNRDSLCVENLALTLPNSTINLPFAAHGTNRNSLLTDQFQMTLQLAASTIVPKDFACFTSLLNNFSDKVDVSANISVSTNDISLEELNVNFGNELFFSGNTKLNNIGNKEDELFIFGQVNRLFATTTGLRRITNNFKQLNMTIPEPVMKIDELNFTGEISGFIDNLVAFGKLSSPVGSIQMDILFGQHLNKDTALYLKGVVTSSDLQIHSLFEEGNPFGKVRFNAELDLVQPTGKHFSGTINTLINELEFRTYNYENIYLSGTYRDNEYEGFVQVNDPNGQLEMQGLFRIEDKKSVFNFNAGLSNFHPDKLYLTDMFEKPDISFGLQANFTGNNPDDFNGHIEVKDFTLQTEKDSFSISNLRLETFTGEQSQKQMNITSPLLKGQIKGHYSFSSLIPNLLNSFENYLPSLVNSLVSSKQAKALNQFEFNFSIDNTKNISQTLKLPVTIIQKADIQGHYNSETHSFFTSANFPVLTLGKMQLENGNVQIDNADARLKLIVSAIQKRKNDGYNFIHVTSELKDDYIHSILKWTNDSDEKYETEIAASTLFVEEQDKNGVKKMRTEITIPQAQMILKDTVWNIEPASVTISDGKVAVDNFYITKGNQHLHINGVLSDNPKDALLLDLNDLEISYIFDIWNHPQVQFGGHATGSIKARDLLGSMMIDGRLEIDNFSFHNAVQGKLILSSEWDNERKGILMIGTIYKNADTYTDVDGYIFPVGNEEGLYLNFNANELNLAFLQRFMRSFSDSISGLGYGNVLLHGPFSEICVEGKPYVKDVSLKFNLLNTTYLFSDTIYLERYQLHTRNTTLYDRDKHTGSLDFILSHTGFKDMSFNMDIKADRLLVYDFSERMNPEIYGKVNVSGTTKITGTEENIVVEGNVRSEAGTSVGFNFSDNSTVENYDFITFVDKLAPTLLDDNNGNDTNDTQESEMDYFLNFLVNVTPDAQLELMMNPETGDKISGTGSGNIQVQYGNKNDMQMFGNYFITRGVYNFNLEQVIRKQFKIRDGSVISFRGDPMTAILDINAIYNLAANIQDLDEQLIKETASPTIPVNCILQLEGLLQNPAITFDLELPNSKSELERQVKSFIDTEDMMTRQIIYLLLLHKFYTPDYSHNSYKTNEFSAVASSALSAQLSNILNSLTDKVQIGTNIRSRQDGIKDTEIEMLLSSQLLNNRLLFNGNFGYKDNYIQNNAFVGEFDLEYKLSRTGEIRLKAYNHANDLYRYTKSLTRQGVGIMFRKDFTILSDLFRRKKKMIDSKETAKEAEAITANPASASLK